MYITFTSDRDRSHLIWGRHVSFFPFQSRGGCPRSTSSLLHALYYPCAPVLQAYLERNRLIRASWTLSSRPSTKPQTLLSLALRNGLCDAADILIRRGCDSEQRDDLGQTGIFHAVTKGMFNSIPYVARFGARFDVTDNNGRTPLHYLCEPGIMSNVHYGTTFTYVHYVVELLLSYGIKVNAQDGSATFLPEMPKRLWMTKGC